jgi:hypothetical protein
VAARGSAAGGSRGSARPPLTPRADAGGNTERAAATLSAGGTGAVVLAAHDASLLRTPGTAASRRSSLFSLAGDTPSKGHDGAAAATTSAGTLGGGSGVLPSSVTSTKSAAFSSRTPLSASAATGGLLWPSPTPTPRSSGGGGGGVPAHLAHHYASGEYHHREAHDRVSRVQPSDAALAAADDAAALAGLDSRVFAAHVCVTWAANALWVACIWAKLVGTTAAAGAPWAVVFVPTWGAHAAQLAVHASALRNTVRHASHGRIHADALLFCLVCALTRALRGTARRAWVRRRAWCAGSWARR